MGTPATIRERLDRLVAHYQEDLRRMTPHARAEQLEITRELLAGNDKPEALRRIEAIDYEREAVSVERFIYEPEFLGQSLKDNIYPALVEDLVEIFEGDYLEVVLTGGIGCGKTRTMEVGFAYEIYLLSLLKNPAKHLGLIPGSTLAMVNVSVNARQASRVLFAGLYGLIESSPYFRNVFPYNRNLICELRFLHKNIVAYPATASEQGVLGEGVFSAAFDEANFMQVVEGSTRSAPGDSGLFDQMQVVYSTLYDRILSRFIQKGKLPGHLWVGSSARFPNDFTERKEAEAKTNPRIFFRRRNVYNTKPRHFFLPETFQVEVGDVGRRSRVLDGSETNVIGRIESIPVDFKPSFLADTDRAVRDIAGYSVLSITPFIPRREKIRKMFELGTQAGLRHPFSRVDERGHPLDVTLQGAAREIEFIVPEHLHYLYIEQPGMYPPGARRLHSGLYWAHVDLAKGQRDKCGMVITHVVAARQIERLDARNLNPVKETLAITRVDLVLRIVAPRNGEVDIPSVRGLFHQFRDLGMEFGKITFDQYQSQESIKALKDAGFKAELFSVDEENATAYEVLKQALYDERVLCYEYPLLERELAQLERRSNKIDHPSVAGSSKDLADCLAAAVYHAEEGYRKGAGSVGMFQIGIVERPEQVAELSALQQLLRGIATGPPLTPTEEERQLFDLDGL